DDAEQDWDPPVPGARKIGFGYQVGAILGDEAADAMVHLLEASDAGEGLDRIGLGNRYQLPGECVAAVSSFKFELGRPHDQVAALVDVQRRGHQRSLGLVDDRGQLAFDQQDLGQGRWRRRRRRRWRWGW